MSKKYTKVGFIGQGWIGKNYADDFERRGFDVIRYALEEPYVRNRKAVLDCSFVFIAVPTPTTPDGFDDSAVCSALENISEGATAVIKSTLLPGTTEKLQKKYSKLFVVHSPEFLREKTAAHDVAHPERNIVGIPKNDDVYHEKAKQILSLLPKARYSKICSSKEAEFIKYIGNGFLFTKVVFMNLLFDMASAIGVDWEVVREAAIADSRIGESHTRPIDQSGHGGKPGRGAGGDCFTKDFATLRKMYTELVGDEHGIAVLRSLETKNINLLIESGKDIDLLRGVYGESIS